MNLFVNCCPRTDSRTKKLADALLDKLGDYEEVNLFETDLEPLNRERLDYRTAKLKKGEYHPPIFRYAKQFAKAENIVIAAPYWDLSFPAMLKIYFEQIYVVGIVAKYNKSGEPIGLCQAEKLYYVTTSGGPLDVRFGYDYVKELAEGCFGIKETALIKAENLDIYGNNADKIMAEAIESICK